LYFAGANQRQKKGVLDSFDVLVKKQKVLNGNILEADVSINFGLHEEVETEQSEDKSGLTQPGMIGLIYLSPKDSGTGKHEGGFEIHVRLPPEELHRLRQIDIAAQRMFLHVKTPLPSVRAAHLPLNYGNDPDGRDLVWDADIAFSSPVEEFQFVITPVEHTPAEEEGLEEDTFPTPKKNSAISDKESNSLGNVMDQVSRFRKIRSLLRMFGL
jgi:hypothetical protein